MMLLATLLFVFFRDNGQAGVYAALSEDGYAWTELKAGRVWLPTTVEGELMRDPYLVRDRSGLYRMIWTWGWRTPRIGYAESRDLVTWTGRKEIPVLADVPETKNVWAPEMIYDEKRKEWIVFWASTIEGRFTETLDQGENGLNHRIYALRTADFVSFTKPEVYFDPGYSVIDSTIVRRGGQWWMAFKDERKTPLMKRMKFATADDPRGPWRTDHQPVTGEWTEGPSLVKLGKDWMMYFDRYRAPQYYGALRSADGGKTWTEVSPKVQLPKGARHGSFLVIDDQTAARLRAVQ